MISEFMFKGCVALREITFEADSGSSLRAIETDGFNGCVNLSRIVLPGSVEEVRPYAFRGCAALTSIRFAGSPALREVGPFMLAGCAALESFAPPDSVEAVRRNGFSECPNLREVVFGANSRLREVEGSSFSGCRSLRRLHLPRSVSSLLPGALHGCPGLAQIEIDENENYETDGEAVVDRRRRELVGWPSARGGVEVRSGIESVFSQAFKDLPITSISLNEVRKIGVSSFEGCSELKCINLSMVRTIENRSFALCSNLVVAEFGEIEYLGDYSFLGVRQIPASIKFSKSLLYLGERIFEGLSEGFIRKRFIYCGNNEFTKDSFEVSPKGENEKVDIKVIVKLSYGYDMFGGKAVTRMMNDGCEIETEGFVSKDLPNLLEISIASLIEEE